MKPPAAHAGGGRVWDLPLRLFHWALALLFGFSVLTVKLGGLWLDWHMRSGYAIVALLGFRLLWGFAGSGTARFSNFLHPPRSVLAYLRGRLARAPGHNPLGGWSVLALLGLLLLQGVTGLFSNDGSFSEGPLARLVSGATSERLSTLHRYGEWALYALVGLHLGAVVFYAQVRREPLVRAMLTGRSVQADAPGIDDGAIMRLRALVLAALAAALVATVVNL